MSWVNDLCKSIKSKCWCWCQCICCPNGDVRTDNDDPPPSTSSSTIEKKIKEFYSSLPNTPLVHEKPDYFTYHTVQTPTALHENVHTHEAKPETPTAHPSIL